MPSTRIAIGDRDAAPSTLAPSDTTTSKSGRRQRPRATPLDSATYRLSVLMPVYNERETIAEAVAEVRASPLRIELICVDDASTDGTSEELDRLYRAGLIDRVIHQSRNQGK